MTTQRPNPSGYTQVTRGITQEQLAAFKEAQDNPQNPEDEPATPELKVTSAPTEDNTDWKKRFSDQSTHLNQIAAAKKAAEEELARLKEEKEQLLAAQRNAREAYASDDVVEKFEEEFTDVAPVVKQLAAREADKLIREAEERFKKALDEKDIKLQKQNEDSEKLQKAHPDWANIKESNEFKEWYAAQSSVVHELGNYEIHKNMDKIIHVLDMFKRDVAPKRKAAERPDNRELQKTPSSSPADTPKSKDLLSYSKWQAELSQAQKLGKRELQAKLLDVFELARKEGRLTN